MLLLLAITSNNFYVLIDAAPDSDKIQYLLSIGQPKNRFKTVYLLQIPPGRMATEFYH